MSDLRTRWTLARSLISHREPTEDNLHLVILALRGATIAELIAADKQEGAA